MKMEPLDLLINGQKTMRVFFISLCQNQVFVNRGNHESAALNLRNGFAKECRSKCGGDHFVHRYFAEVFRWMPLAHLVNGRILVMHGGLSSNLILRLDDIRAIRSGEV